MLYFSNLVGKPVVDADNQRVGRLKDMLAAVHSAHPQPQIVALVVSTAAHDALLVPMTQVAVVAGPAVILTSEMNTIAPFDPGDCLWLARDVLDKEIVDTDGARVVRVNDVQLVRANGHVYLTNVNTGGLAILRRLGLAHIAEKAARRLGRTLTTGAIPWEDVDLMPGAQHVRLRFSGKAADMPAADLAEIISDLSPSESSQIVESLDVEQLADTLEEVEPDFQASLVQSLPDEKVADLLEEMSPDEAADLLAELPEDRSQSLLALMEKDEAAGVRQLLAYPEDSAGGLMTTDVITVRPHLTAAQTIAFLRQTAQEAETIYYVYVTDEHDHLLGVCSLQSIVLAEPKSLISAIMHDRVVSVGPEADQNDVAQLVANYNLLAVPVVDSENRLLGIVTADDALDKILPTAWKRHLPRLYG